MNALGVVTGRIDDVITHLADVFDTPNIDYEKLVVFTGWLQVAFKVALYKKQLPCYDIPNPPESLKEHLPKETYDKAQVYGRDKTRYAMLETIFDQFVSFGMIRLGVYSSLWNFTGDLLQKLGYSTGTLAHSLIWISIITALSSVVSLPWNYYFTFVIEERHGFNKSTKMLWVMDQIKSWFLLAAIGLPFLAGFLKVIEWAGRSFVPWLMLFLLVFILTLQVIYPTFIQPLFNKLEPLPAGELRDRVETLAGKLGFPLKHLYVIDGSKRSGHSNAYFYGLPWSKHIVIFDTLIEQSSPAEVEAVLGHELGHWKYAHPTKLLLVVQAQLLFTFTVFAIFIHNKALFSAFGFDPALATSTSGGPILIGFTLFQMLVSPFDTLINFLVHALTRKYEYQADEFSVQLGKKEDLKAALIKLHVKNLSSPHNNKLYSMYHHSHPTLPERLRAMDVYADALKKKSQ